MDKYSIGRAVTASTSFPKCKGLMINNSNTAANTNIHVYDSAGVTFAVVYTAAANESKIIPVQCASIGTIGANCTVTALY